MYTAYNKTLHYPDATAWHLYSPVNVLESACVRDRVAERGIVVEREVGGEGGCQ